MTNNNRVHSQKIPPQAPDAERSVLGSCLTSLDALDTAMELLKPDMFYSTAHQLIFTGMVKMHSGDILVDMVTLCEQLILDEVLDQIGTEAYISELTENVSTTSNITKHCEILIEKDTLRQLITIGNNITNQAFGNEKSSKIIQAVDIKLMNLFNQTKKNETLHLREIAPTAFEKIEEAQKGKKNGITTGFRALDDKMGPYANGDLTIIAARPSMGKSAFMGCSAYNSTSISNKPVLIFSLEMTQVKLFNRILSSECEINGRKIRQGNLEKDEHMKIARMVGEIVNKNIYINDNPNLNIYQIRTICNRYKRKYNIGMVMIDYLQFIADVGNKETKAQETGEKSRVGKMIAKDLDIPVVMFSQLNRGLESRTDKIPKLSDLRESGDIEQDADAVVFIYRPCVYDIQENPLDVNLIIGKNRDGPVGMVKDIVFKKEYTLFSQIADYEKDADQEEIQF